MAGLLALGISGCTGPEYKEGEVIKEGGTVVNLVESGGALFGDKSVKFGDPTYILTVKTDDGIYTINVIEDEYQYKSLGALSDAIEVGDRVKFVTNYHDYKTLIGHFGEDRIGTLPSMCVERLDK